MGLTSGMTDYIYAFPPKGALGYDIHLRCNRRDLCIASESSALHARARARCLHQFFFVVYSPKVWVYARRCLNALPPPRLQHPRRIHNSHSSAAMTLFRPACTSYPALSFYAFTPLSLRSYMSPGWHGLLDGVHED